MVVGTDFAGCPTARCCPRSLHSMSCGSPAPIAGDGPDGSAVVQLTTTVAERADADRIADALLDARLAACVQIVGPITSRYRWKDAIEESAELLLIVKTTMARSHEAIAAVVAVHPYDVPEVLLTPVGGGHGAYLEWVTQNVE